MMQTDPECRAYIEERVKEANRKMRRERREEEKPELGGFISEKRLLA